MFSSVLPDQNPKVCPALGLFFRQPNCTIQYLKKFDGRNTTMQQKQQQMVAVLPEQVLPCITSITLGTRARKIKKKNFFKEAKREEREEKRLRDLFPLFFLLFLFFYKSKLLALAPEGNTVFAWKERRNSNFQHKPLLGGSGKVTFVALLVISFLPISRVLVVQGYNA